MNYDSLQEVFNYVVAHMRKQETKPNCENRWYRYRDKDGKPSSVGCLISDSNYTSDLEGIPVIDLYVGFELPEVITTRNVGLLMELQDIHDMFQIDEWEFQLKHLASSINLTYNEINK